LTIFFNGGIIYETLMKADGKARARLMRDYEKKKGTPGPTHPPPPPPPTQFPDSNSADAAVSRSMSTAGSLTMANHTPVLLTTVGPIQAVTSTLLALLQPTVKRAQYRTQSEHAALTAKVLHLCCAEAR